MPGYGHQRSRVHTRRFARLPPTRRVLTSLWILGEMKRDRAFGGICITLVIRRAYAALIPIIKSYFITVLERLV